MKRYIKATTDAIRVIEVDIYLDYADDYLVAAGAILTHPRNIRKRNRISDVKLQILNDIAASIKSRVENSPKFKKTKETPPGKNKDYTYYIQFDVYNDAGEKLVPVGIKFRISNHRMRGSETPVDSDTVIIRSFVVKGKHYENSVQIIQTLNRMCAELERGNVKVLDMYSC